MFIASHSTDEKIEAVLPEMRRPVIILLSVPALGPKLLLVPWFKALSVKHWVTSNHFSFTNEKINSSIFVIYVTGHELVIINDLARNRRPNTWVLMPSWDHETTEIFLCPHVIT